MSGAIAIGAMAAVSGNNTLFVFALFVLLDVSATHHHYSGSSLVLFEMCVFQLP